MVNFYGMRYKNKCFIYLFTYLGPLIYKKKLIANSSEILFKKPFRAMYKMP